MLLEFVVLAILVQTVVDQIEDGQMASLIDPRFGIETYLLVVT